MFKRKAFIAPLKEFFLDPSGEITSPWQWFFRQTQERLSPLGFESSFKIPNGISSKSFATTDVNTTTNQITESAHGYFTGLAGMFSSTGTLPTGLNSTDVFYVIRVNANTYAVALSPEDAEAGNKIDISSQGSGTHTFTPFVEVEGLGFDYRQVTSAVVEYLVQRVTTGAGATELIESGIFIVSYLPTSNSWSLHSVSADNPHDSGVTFTISSEGQVQCQSSAITGTDSISRMFWRARTLGGKNHQFSSFGSTGR